ncbi:MAG: hypothetical protein Q4P20_10295 [Eubacteriales bacterium]|nr:hypothetical protein [Eubacteriales bacterium]
MRRETLSEDIERTFKSRLIGLPQIAKYVGISENTARAEICSRCTEFKIGHRKKYHVRDIAAAIDHNGNGIRSFNDD